VAEVLQADAAQGLGLEAILFFRTPFFKALHDIWITDVPAHKKDETYQ
jgi:hypothetical protein